ncbi:hypothetical protein ASE21_11730 [Flavobacterium sp. Root901]|uniref:hypothetical protein n=1 Tax=Flavobacterium sp. Root901 TaxID=1736605 RepID=UPI0007091DB3|nr:hypothetical protein [Flavobacterium sp. Root901]KRD10372.1 hypothetical protein ASE21_11730 [Flavobacterium sp. Root901]
MKRLLKTKIVMLLLISAFVMSCKKNENNAVEPGQKDSTDLSVDTIGPAVDSSATLNSGQNGTNGTTGATGEGSTGSGTAGSTQKGNQNIRTDSIKK